MCRLKILPCSALAGVALLQGCSIDCNHRTEEFEVSFTQAELDDLLDLLDLLDQADRADTDDTEVPAPSTVSCETACARSAGEEVVRCEEIEPSGNDVYAATCATRWYCF